MLLPSIFSENFVTDVFDEMFRTPLARNGMASVNSMHSDIKELDESFEIAMELPGFAKEDIGIELKEGYLTVKATRDTNSEEKDEQGKFLRRERFSGSCQRSFYVGDKMKEEEIKAKFKDGVLTIEIPKVQALPDKAEKKMIAIEG